MTRKLWTSIVSALGLFVLILDTKTALLGAAEGIALCIRSVIPSLFPFFVLSILLTSSLAGERIRLLRPLGRLCGIADGTESLLLVGILGGYPSGAQSIAQTYRDGILSKQDATRMLAFCNFAGPAFLFGIVASKFSSSYVPWVLWGIHILSAVLVAVILPNRSKHPTAPRHGTAVTLQTALQRSIRIMAGVCAWIILFRILIFFIERWFLWLLPTALQVTIAGLLELTNGCCALEQISSEGLRFIISSGLLAFGGLCVTMQTATVTSGLPLKSYLWGKLLQTFLCVIISAMLQFFLFSPGDRIHISVYVWAFLTACTGILLGIARKKQKKCSFSQSIGV